MKKISFWALILLIVSAVDSNRNLPSAAIFGSPLIFFYLFSALFFLFPTALVSAELSATFPEQGGVYHWVRNAFGEKVAMCAIWLQWINTMVWYPTILSFLAGTGAYLFDPALMESKSYMVVAISAIFWSLTLVNLRGIRMTARVNALLCGVGTIFPMLFLIALGGYWVARGEPLAISLSPQAIFPSLTKWDTWTALEGIMGSFLGMELAGVHVNHIADPQKNFPRAVGISSLYILFTMLLGSLTIALVLPMGQINLAGGLMQVFADFFRQFHLEPLIFAMSIFIVLGSFGGMINWIVSPAKGLLHAAEFGYLPPFFAKMNGRGVASRILIAQAVLVTLFCSLFLLLPTINAFYWFLTALSNCLYMTMYLLMFAAAWRLRRVYTPGVFRIPGGKGGLALCCLFGAIGATSTIFFGFLPPPNVNVGSPLHYTAMIGAGNLLLMSPILYFFWVKRKLEQ